ncbi:MAG: hypothetical protein A3H35_11265 [Betaproteobacteria bacterium RIFCSPLOWO2_02_FULL_62_17]|nr:MAG: hypothetical protein A3H35_11265 [Betaproteobacteria bacterium RIFCSPLOWO2_02_FULL_62_17]
MVAVCCGLLPLPAAQAAPFLPADDAQILESLPTKPGDPVALELRTLRAALAKEPRNPDRAVELAQRYFDLASAEGDPRYIGYAEAVIRPWLGRDIPVEVLFTRALLRQYRHDFLNAMDDLDSVLAHNPAHAEALGWKWALYMVMADYARARGACEKRKGVASPLSLAACFATIDSRTGNVRAAYAALDAAFKRNPSRTPENRQWMLTRLGEIALQAGDPVRAERHFREAIATGVTDGYVLAAYADLLLDQKRHADVITLLKDWARSDIQLLRLAVAEKSLGTQNAPALVQALADRFADAALRGDKLHLAEEARFELLLRNNPARAVELAVENWNLLQREPYDARILLETALAAKNPAAARPALDWLRESGYEEARFRELGKALGKIAQ